MTVQFESSEPITYGKYKNLLKKFGGLNAMKDYELRLNDQLITDDSMIIDDS